MSNDPYGKVILRSLIDLVKRSCEVKENYIKMMDDILNSKASDVEKRNKTKDLIDDFIRLYRQCLEKYEPVEVDGSYLDNNISTLALPNVPLNAVLPNAVLLNPPLPNIPPSNPALRVIPPIIDEKDESDNESGNESDDDKSNNIVSDKSSKESKKDIDDEDMAFFAEYVKRVSRRGRNPFIIEVRNDKLIKQCQDALKKCQDALKKCTEGLNKCLAENNTKELSSVIEQLNSHITNLKIELDRNQNQCNEDKLKLEKEKSDLDENYREKEKTMKDEISELKQRIEDIKKNISSTERQDVSDLIEQNNKIKELESALAELSRKYDELLDIYNDCKEANTGYVETIDDITKEIQKLTEETKSNRKQFDASCGKQMDELKFKIEQLHAQLELERKSKNSNSEEIKNLEEQIKKLSDDKNALTRQLTECKESVVKKNEEIKKLNDEIGRFQNIIKESEEKEKTYVEKIGKVSKTLNDNIKIVETITQNNTKLEQLLSQTIEEKERCVDALTAIEARLRILNSQIVVFEEKTSLLQEDKNKLQQEYDELKQQFEQCKKRENEYKTQLETNQKQINEMNTRIQELERQLEECKKALEQCESEKKHCEEQLQQCKENLQQCKEELKRLQEEKLKKPEQQKTSLFGSMFRELPPDSANIKKPEPKKDNKEEHKDDIDKLCEELKESINERKINFTSRFIIPNKDLTIDGIKTIEDYQILCADNENVYVYDYSERKLKPLHLHMLPDKIGTNKIDVDFEREIQTLMKHLHKIPDSNKIDEHKNIESAGVEKVMEDILKKTSRVRLCANKSCSKNTRLINVDDINKYRNYPIKLLCKYLYHGDMVKIRKYRSSIDGSIKLLLFTKIEQDKRQQLANIIKSIDKNITEDKKNNILHLMINSKLTQYLLYDESSYKYLSDDSNKTIDDFCAELKEKNRLKLSKVNTQTNTNNNIEPNSLANSATKKGSGVDSWLSKLKENLNNVMGGLFIS
jgi:DNA repair exonuclease SbcCD ATPase subunit